MRVALVNPLQSGRYPQPPMGLATLAAVLEKSGHRVSIIDANALNIKPESIVPYLDDSDVVGLTAMTPSIKAAADTARQVKLAKPELPVVLGGAHATLLPEETLSSAPGVDVIVRGEGEAVILDLLRSLENRQPLDGIGNITYRKDGKIASNSLQPTSVDLDSLPFLAYHLLPWKKYRPHPPHGRALPFAAIITSRGCPYHCAYCSKPIFGNKFRAQSPERVLEELAYYRDRFGIREVAFYDDVFTLNKSRAHSIADGMISRGIKLHWTCETRVNLVDKELLQHMRRAGCYGIAYGVESASPEILGALHKGITLDQVEEAVRLTREVGIQTIGYFMIGSPGETPETIAQTVRFAKRLRLDFAQFAVTTPFPGTELYDFYLKNKGDGAVSWENFVYAGTGNGVAPVFESDRLSRSDLQCWAGRAYREFYLRPSYLWQRLRRLTSFGDLKVNIKGAAMLIGNIKPASGTRK